MVYLVGAITNQSTTSLPERFDCSSSNMFYCVAKCRLWSGKELQSVAWRILDYVHLAFWILASQYIWISPTQWTWGMVYSVYVYWMYALIGVSTPPESTKKLWNFSVINLKALESLENHFGHSKSWKLHNVVLEMADVMDTTVMYTPQIDDRHDRHVHDGRVYGPYNRRASVLWTRPLCP